MIRALVELLHRKRIADMGVAASPQLCCSSCLQDGPLISSDTRLTHDAGGRIQRMLQSVKLLVIDEMSMLSAYYLGMIHERMRRALRAIPVLLVGDFNQLKPCTGLS